MIQNCNFYREWEGHIHPHGTEWKPSECLGWFYGTRNCRPGLLQVESCTQRYLWVKNAGLPVFRGWFLNPVVKKSTWLFPKQNLSVVPVGRYVPLSKVPYPVFCCSWIEEKATLGHLFRSSLPVQGFHAATPEVAMPALYVGCTYSGRTWAKLSSREVKPGAGWGERTLTVL